MGFRAWSRIAEKRDKYTLYLGLFQVQCVRVIDIRPREILLDFPMRALIGRSPYTVLGE